jgi:hypothetical protein
MGFEPPSVHSIAEFSINFFPIFFLPQNPAAPASNYPDLPWEARTVRSLGGGKVGNLGASRPTRPRIAPSRAGIGRGVRGRVEVRPPVLKPMQGSLSQKQMGRVKLGWGPFLFRLSGFFWGGSGRILKAPLRRNVKRPVPCGTPGLLNANFTVDQGI